MGSEKHVQKFGVIYKVHGSSQIEDQIQEEMEVKNMKLIRTLKKMDKVYSSMMKTLADTVEEWYWDHTLRRSNFYV
jgi:hypothetical protein